MPGLEQLVVADRERARADEAHLAAQDVQHLGDLVDREPSQHASDTGDAGIVADLEEGALGLVLRLELGLPGLRVRVHRPELEHAEVPFVQADPQVAEEHGAA